MQNGASDVSTPETQEPPSQRKCVDSVEIHAAESSGMIDEIAERKCVDSVEIHAAECSGMIGEIAEKPNNMTEQNLKTIPQEVLQILPNMLFVIFIIFDSL